jgi:NAD(P)H-dependent flavin oxidoreductase YrpB (nitropropane dioxygenase family)
MNVAAGPELAAAVSNAGGLGVIGGLGYTYVCAQPCQRYADQVDPRPFDSKLRKSNRVSNPPIFVSIRTTSIGRKVLMSSFWS